jgi:glycosyltransferase involved in cell wall biosynthesis
MQISVIIPTYKSPEALDLCLESCIKGQQNNNQIIVVVDGFMDLNKEVLDKHKDKIQILEFKNNVGLCKGTNFGVYNARNERILIVNDDNVFPLDWDVKLNEDYDSNTLLTPNQIEPYPSMFNQIHIKDLGRHPNNFSLEEYQNYDLEISNDLVNNEGSTLPIFMSKTSYLKVGGWDESYELGVVADWDFFLKCQLAGIEMKRSYKCHFYHFVSLSTSTTPEQKANRRQKEINGHNYAKYKWGDYIKHDPKTNIKYI